MPVSRLLCAVVGLTLASAPLVVADPVGFSTPKQTVALTAAHGREVTLDAGALDGVKVGTVYGIAHDGKVVARVRVTQTGPRESTAVVVQSEPGVVVAVGDSAQFIAVLPVPNPVTPQRTPVPLATMAPTAAPPTPAPTAIVVPPAVPLVTEAPTTVKSTPVPPQPPATVTTIGTSGTDVVSGNAYLTDLKGTAATLNAGTDRGVQPGAHLPVVRAGNVVALIRIQTATPTASTGVVIWRDETVAAPAAGDAVAIVAGGATTSGGTTTSTPGPTVAPIAAPGGAARESGLSNAVVPRADHVYEQLAALAAWDIVTRYPAAVFQDEGTRRHRTEEDITFTRAQIADIIRESLDSPKLREPSSRVATVMGDVVREYGPELRQLGVSDDSLTAVTGKRAFGFALSGFRRATAVGGDTDANVIEPFSERQGGRRTRSGLDSRNNVFARYGDNLRFFGTLESGSDTHRNRDEHRYELRRAIASYDAGRTVRGLTIEAGRDELWWGPGHFGTLLLSDAAGSLGMVHTTVKRGSLKFEGLYAPLDTGPLGGTRSLYGHNLQYQFTPQLRLGVAETVLLPKDKMDPLLTAAAFLPFPLFTAERIRHRGTSTDNGNAIIMPYVEAGVAAGAQVYAEVLLDDLGTNNNDLVRSRAGTLAGIHLFTPRDPARLGMYAEYANLEGRTYLGLQAISDNDFYYRRNPLGYAVAPLQGPGNGGASSLRFDSYWMPRRRIRLGLGAEFSDINSEQPVLSRQQVLRARASYDISQKWTLTARAQRVQTSQPNFIANEPAIHENLYQLEVARSF